VRVFKGQKGARCAFDSIEQQEPDMAGARTPASGQSKLQ